MNEYVIYVEYKDSSFLRKILEEESSLFSLAYIKAEIKMKQDRLKKTLKEHKEGTTSSVVIQQCIDTYENIINNCVIPVSDETYFNILKEILKEDFITLYINEGGILNTLVIKEQITDFSCEKLPKRIKELVSILIFYPEIKIKGVLNGTM